MQFPSILDSSGNSCRIFTFSGRSLALDKKKKVIGGDRCECALNTFILLGDDRTADVVKRANEYFVANRNRLHAAWEDGTKKSFCIGYKEKLFDAFDKEYYTLMNSDNQLYELIGTYIKHHPQEFLSEEETRQRYDNNE
ncbi:DUF4375 domain-containing protein [Bacteroides fragilis]|uniref:DUF4375 domain-containing protein n=1 Tax=Bacteroides fragilis TaxID=817 RepID=A0A412YKE5_BACFG|nr:DUF4375 domain-containing protein [Bacteroides fragilis]RGV82544.1 DUF4375 domain-containing protein [Bacteroides fragilis]